MMRQAIGLQQSPPNQVLVGLSLFLSLMIMQKPLNQVYDEAITPFMQGEVEVLDAVEIGMDPMRDFMLANTRRADLQTMLGISQIANVQTLEEIPSTVVVSSFLLSELKTAFVIGVKIYLPFLVLDIIVANILLGMGMMVLPPIIISLPFKIMLFVLMDGWSLLITSITSSFYGV
jgi:flagellar biosynthetic protein FliP